MEVITAQNFLEPFVILLREGTKEDPYVNITETIRLIPSINMDAGVYNVAILREIPLLTQGVTATINGIQLMEIRDSLTAIDDEHFKVDYTNGRVYLSSTYINNEVTFGYKGRGVILVNSERILLSYGGDMENLYTLDRYVQEHMGEVNIGELENLKTQAKDKVVNAINEIWDETQEHFNNKENPHETTKAQVGLGNADNTSDINKPVSTAQKTYIDDGDNDVRGEFASADEILQGQIDALKGAYIYIGTINLNTANVTQQALTTRAEELMQTTTLQTGWVLIDNEKHDWYYNADTTTWLDLDTSNIYNATNTTYGIVKGNSNVSIVDGLMEIILANDSSKLGGQLPSYYGTSEAVNNRVLKSGDTMTGTLELPAATVALSSLRVPHGVAPTTPVNGDLWSTSSGIFFRRNGTTVYLYDNTNAPTANLTTITQSEAEAGSSTTTRAWTSQRVRQAIDARSWTNETLVASITEPDPITGKTILWVDLN